MLKNFLLFLSAFTLAFVILVISIFRVAEIKYVLSESPNFSPPPIPLPKEVTVDYTMPYPGRIAPDSFLWPAKAIRDKVWIALTFNPSKKAELYLMLADKRLASALTLFENEKADLGLSVLAKGEIYLEMAGQEERLAKKAGMDTKEFLTKYALATLKHRLMIKDIEKIAPEDAKPTIVKTSNYSKKLYEEAKNGLLAVDAPVPLNPFTEN